MLQVMILRGIAQLFQLRGAGNLAKAFGVAATLYAAQKNVDSYAKAVNEKLERGEDIDADELLKRIESEGDKFQEPVAEAPK